MKAAIVLPVLVVLIYRWDAMLRRGSFPTLQVGTLCLIAGVYLAAWNLFFAFQITRFPVERSSQSMLFSYFKAVGHSFHGSSRLAIAALYILLLYGLSLRKEYRRFLLFAFLWPAVPYLPFGIVHGYADRFAYLASAGVAVILSSGAAVLVSRNRPIGLLAAWALMAFLTTGMVGRMRVWKRAGVIAEAIPKGVRRLHPVVAPGT